MKSSSVASISNLSREEYIYCKIGCGKKADIRYKSKYCLDYIGKYQVDVYFCSQICLDYFDNNLKCTKCERLGEMIFYDSKPYCKNSFKNNLSCYPKIQLEIENSCFICKKEPYQGSSIKTLIICNQCTKSLSYSKL